MICIILIIFSARRKHYRLNKTTKRKPLFRKWCFYVIEKVKNKWPHFTKSLYTFLAYRASPEVDKLHMKKNIWLEEIRLVAVLEYFVTVCPNCVYTSDKWSPRKNCKWNSQSLSSALLFYLSANVRRMRPSHASPFIAIENFLDNLIPQNISII